MFILKKGHQPGVYVPLGALFLVFFFFAQNIDRGYTLEPLTEAVLTSTHNLCFRAKIRKKMYTPVNPSFSI